MAANNKIPLSRVHHSERGIFAAIGVNLRVLIVKRERVEPRVRPITIEHHGTCACAPGAPRYTRGAERFQTPQRVLVENLSKVTFALRNCNAHAIQALNPFPRSSRRR